MRIGVDLGGTKIESVLVADDGSGVERHRTATPADEGYEAVLDEIGRHVARLDAAAGSECTVGVGTPGAVSSRTGTLKNSNTACLRGRPILGDLTMRLGPRVRVANDANCFAVAEALGGAGRGAHVVFGVILGTGVGGGVVIDGRAHEGLHGIAGEWGHSPIGGDGPDCYCGQRGCVETRLSGTGFEADYTRATGRTATAKQILTLAELGDGDAEACFQRYLGWFGEGIARVIHVLDPDVVVLGGGMSRNPRLYDEGRAAVAAVLFNDELLTPILRHELGDSAGVLGAAWLW